MKYLRMILTVALLAGAIWVASKFVFSVGTRSVLILDYKPTELSASLSKPHFFQINGSLGFSSQLIIDQELFKGDISNVLVSPNGLLAVVVTSKEVWLVSGDGSLKQKIGNTRSILDKNTELGKSYFRSDTIQWSHDSRLVYLLLDEQYEPDGGFQLFSEKSDLVEYNIETLESTVLISPLRTNQYFLSKNLTLYYYSDDSNGSINLYKTSLNQLSDSTELVEADSIDLSIACDIFYSFSRIGDNVPLQRIEGFSLTRSEADAEIWLISKNEQEILRIRGGITSKGSWHGVNIARSSVLRNEPYLLVDIYSESYVGVLLVEIETGSYMEFGESSSVYQANNTCNTSEWRITDTGIENY